MRIQKKRESGFLMITVIFVLAIIGLASLAVFVGRTNVQTRKKVIVAQKDIADIVLNVRALTLKIKDFSTVSNINTVESGRDFLAKMRSTETPFGAGSYYSVVFDQNYPDAFGVYVVNINRKYCKTLETGTYDGAEGFGCGETYANLQFLKKQQKFGVGVAINTDTGLTRVEDRFGVFYKKQ